MKSRAFFYMKSAANNGHLDIVRLLIANGADLNQTSRTSLSALHFACMINHYAVVSELIVHGCTQNRATL